MPWEPGAWLFEGSPRRGAPGQLWSVTDIVWINVWSLLNRLLWKQHFKQSFSYTKYRVLVSQTKITRHREEPWFTKDPESRKLLGQHTFWKILRQETNLLWMRWSSSREAPLGFSHCLCTYHIYPSIRQCQMSLFHFLNQFSPSPHPKFYRCS